MARHRDVHIDGGWYLIEITPDWERIHALQARIDLGDTKAMGEFIDLIVYEEDTERYMDYVKRAAKMGYDKALYALHKPNNSVIPIKKSYSCFENLPTRVSLIHVSSMMKLKKMC